MTVYVDEIFTAFQDNVATRKYGKQWCHLAVATDDELEELHRFAQSIGLSRSWFQDRKGLPHYDLTPAMQKRAIKAGATPVTRKQLFLMCKRYS